MRMVATTMTTVRSTPELTAMVRPSCSRAERFPRSVILLVRSQPDDECSAAPALAGCGRGTLGVENASDGGTDARIAAPRPPRPLRGSAAEHRSRRMRGGPEMTSNLACIGLDIEH